MTQVIERTSSRAGLRRTLRRQAAERACRLATFLPEVDRLLIEQVYAHGLSVAEVARLRGEHARRLQRRVAKLLCRMRKPAFTLVASREDLLPREVRATARRVVLEGMSLRRTAQVTGQSLHHVREHMRTVRALAHL